MSILVRSFAFNHKCGDHRKGISKMPNHNQVILAGHLGKDPVIHKNQRGTAFCNMTVATSRGKDNDRTTEWHQVVLIGKQAEGFASMFKKGDVVTVPNGWIETRSWEDKEGIIKYVTEIKCWEAFGRVRGAPSQQHQDTNYYNDDEVPF